MVDARLVERFHTALCEAFDRPSLEQLLRFRLRQRLYDIAGEGGLSEVVFDLLAWGERCGRLLHLARAAAVARPMRADLHLICQELEETVSHTCTFTLRVTVSVGGDGSVKIVGLT